MLEQIIDIVKEAGKIAKEGYEKHKEIDFKTEIDLVTQYDIRIEQFLTKRLQDEFEDFEIIGEELGSSGYKGGSKMIIDPIDGTTNFIHQIPFFAISIGVYVEKHLTFGIVYNPILDELFTAQKGHGAFLNGKPIHVSDSSNLTRCLVATGFPYTKYLQGDDYKWTVENFKNILPLTRDMRRLGAASLDLCYVARGTFDAYYEINLKPWDVAAGWLIVEEAGGKVTNGVDDTYSLGEKLIVATNGEIHKSLCTKLLRVVDE